MTPARFHALRDRTVVTVDRTFAEPVKLFFLKNGVADPGRAAIQIEAPLRTGPRKGTDPSGGIVREWRSRIAAGRGEMRVDRAKYPSLVLRSGDKVQAISRPGEPLFEVLIVDDRDHSRLIVQLGEA